MINRDLLVQLAEFDTPLLANTIGYIDPTPAHEYYMSGDIQSVTPELGPTVGVAFTCELDSSTPGGRAEPDAYWRQLEQIEQEDRPVVWVVKTVGSRPHHECVIGDGMASILYAAGCVGIVTDGGVRDVAGLLAVPFAAYARGKVVHHCDLRFRNEGCPVEIGGITVRTGDVLHADSAGVIRIPHSCIDTLRARAIQMRAFEHEAHQSLRRKDISLAEKRDRVKQLLAEYGFAK